MGLTPGRNEVALVLEGQEVDGCCPPLAALASAHAQLPRAPHAEPGAGEESDDRVADVRREPPGTDVSGIGLTAGHSGSRYPRRQRVRVTSRSEYSRCSSMNCATYQHCATTDPPAARTSSSARRTSSAPRP